MKESTNSESGVREKDSIPSRRCQNWAPNITVYDLATMDKENDTKIIDISFPKKALCPPAEPSPSNMNASCISAITFDSSPTSMKASHAVEKRSKDGLVPHNHLHNDPSPHSKEPSNSALSSTQDMKQSPFVKGSLYSRLMTGFQNTDAEIGTNNDNQRGSSIDVPAMTPPEQEASSKCSRSDEAQDLCIDVDEDSIVEEIQMEGEEIVTAFEDIENTEMHSIDMNKADTSMKIEDLTKDENAQMLQSDLRVPGGQSEDETKDAVVDQWREVFDDRTGKTYYYNRRTRESRWTLPSNGSLLGKKRQVHRATNLNINLHQVSMSGITEDSAFQQSLHDFGSFDQSAYSNNPDMSACAKSQQDEEETRYIHESCKTLRKLAAFNSEEKRFFPNDTGEVDDMHAMEDDTFVSKSPLKEEMENSALFCMYCGKSIQTAHEMKNHLHFHCHHYDDYKSCKKFEHEQLKLNLKLVWNNLGGDKENEVPNGFQSNRFKEDILNLQPNESITTTSHICNKSEDIFSISDDEDTVLDGEIQRQYQKSVNEGSEYNQIVSTCAFCSKTFRSGNKLSKHFLLCKKRNMISNKKRTKSALHPFDDVTNKAGMIIDR